MSVAQVTALLHTPLSSLSTGLKNLISTVRVELRIRHVKAETETDVKGLEMSPGARMPSYRECIVCPFLVYTSCSASGVRGMVSRQPQLLIFCSNSCQGRVQAIPQALQRAGVQGQTHVKTSFRWLEAASKKGATVCMLASPLRCYFWLL